MQISLILIRIIKKEAYSVKRSKTAVFLRLREVCQALNRQQ